MTTFLTFGVRAGRYRGSGTKYYFYSLMAAIGLMSCMDTVQHDASSAAKKAEEFARAVFVRQDIETGYPLLADGTKRYVSQDQFKVVVEKLHPQGFPKTVTALEYEPMPGEKAIYIFLIGDRAGEHFYYRLTMEGTASTGYKVLRFDRSLQPYSPSNDRKRLSGPTG
jgi:hypothetical protein